MEINQEKKWCIYKHTNKINGKVYIGQTCLTLEERSNKGKNYKNCTYFYNAIQKYGWDNFEHEILEENLTLKEANNLEEKYISLYDSTNPTKGYNLRSGGQNSTHSDETKEKLKILFSGENNPNWKGATTTEESRKKMSESHKGKKLSESHKNNISKGNIGRKFSKETREKISKAVSGEKNGMYGKHHTEETILLKSKPVICVETNTVYKSATEAAKKLNLHQGSITNCCLKRQHTTGGYHWKYYEDGSAVIRSARYGFGEDDE